MSGSEEFEEPLTRLIVQGEVVDPIEERKALEAVQAQLFDAAFRPLALGRYVVLGPIGAGGGGVVYRAYDPELHRKVAVKVLHTGGDRDSAARTRLLREAQAIAKLSHPNIVAVHDVGVLDGVGALGDGVFMVMELVEGQTLAQWLEADRERPWSEVLRVFIDAGNGLAAAHREDLVHRDFKPGNVLVGDDGRVRVLDFGLARHRADLSGAPVEEEGSGQTDMEPLDAEMSATPELLARELTGAGAVLGTPAYMAPEQHAGEDADARSDQFAFCVALWQALYAERPYQAKTLDGLAREKQAGPPKTPSTSTRGRIPRWVEAALVRALSPDPSARYESIDSLLRDLGRNPRQGWVRALGFTGFGIVAAAVVFSVTTGPGPPACDAGAIDELWDEPKRALAREAFEATDEPYAAGAWKRADLAMAKFVQTWKQERAATCEIESSGSDPGATLRRLCLERELETFGEVGRLLADADGQVVRNAVAVTGRLPDPTRCRAVAADVGRSGIDAADRERLGRLDAELLRARVHLDAGKYDETKRACASVLTALREDDDPAIAARAHLLQCEVHYLDDRDEKALGHCERAIEAAERGGSPALVVEASTLLGRTLSSLGRAEEAQRVFAITRARVHGLPAEARDPFLEARLELAIGLSLDTAWQPDAAEPHLERALVLHEQIFGDTSPELISVVNGLAMMAGGRGELATAKSRYERALGLSREAYGAQHPTTASLLNNLAGVERRLGDAAASHEHLLEVLDAKEAVNGPDSPRLVSTLNNLGRALVELRRADEAVAYHERALAIVERQKGGQSSALVPSLSGLGRAMRRASGCEQAMPTLERALELMRTDPGSGSEMRPEVLLELGLCQLDADLDASGRHIREAVEQARHRPGERSRQYAETLAGLAQWQRASGQEVEARQTLERALGIASSTEGDDAQLEALRAALAGIPGN